MQVRENPVPLAAQNKPKITGMRSRGVILFVHEEVRDANFVPQTPAISNSPLNRNTEWLVNPSHPRKCAPEVDMFTLKS